MKKTLAIILSAAIALLGLTACDGSNEQEEQTPPYPVTADNVTIEKRPKAVASLSPALTKILLDLGYQNRIVGYPEEDTIPDPLPEPESTSSEEPAWWKFWVEESSTPVSDPAPSEVEHIGTALEPDLPAVGKVKPEIIFTAVPFTKAQMDKLTQVKIKVVVMPAVTSVEELKNRYLEIVKIMDGQLEADLTGVAITDEIQGQLDYIQSKVPAERKSFLYVTSSDPLFATKDTLEGALLCLIGENLAGDAAEYTIDSKALAELDPDVIFYSAPMTAESFTSSELFKNKRAVTEGNLIEIDHASLLLQTREISDSLRAAAKLLYPDVDFTAPAPAQPVGSGTDSSAAESTAE